MKFYSIMTIAAALFVTTQHNFILAQDFEAKNKEMSAALIKWERAPFSVKIDSQAALLRKWIADHPDDAEALYWDYLIREHEQINDRIEMPTVGIEQLAKIADRGSARAKARLAYCHFFAIHTKQSYGDAIRLANEAAKTDIPLAHTVLAVIYHTDGLVDAKRSIFHIEKAASLGDPLAQSKIASLTFSGDGYIQQDREKGMKNLIELAKSGNSFAKTYLADIYMRGTDGVGRDVVKGYSYLADAALAGSPDAMFDYAHVNRSSRSNTIPKDESKAKKFFLMSAKAGLAKSQSVAGNDLVSGKYGSSKQAFDLGIHFLDKSSQSRIPVASERLGLICGLGLGVDRNSEKSTMLFRKSVDDAKIIAKQYNVIHSPSDIFVLHGSSADFIIDTIDHLSKFNSDRQR